MTPEELSIQNRPSLDRPRMVLGFSGWMDGGDVSTGVVEDFAAKLDAEPLAEVDPGPFNLASFPGSMEVSALFRPHTKIEDGLVVEYEEADRRFLVCQDQNLILFLGKEPNFSWHRFGDCIFSVADAFDVSTIFFIGSVAGLVPHTREPRLYSSVSRPKLKEFLEPYRVRFSNYEGPASISTYLTHRAQQTGKDMVTLVAEIPAYVQGINHRCIESVARHLAAMLRIQLDLDDLRELGDRLEEKLDEVVGQRPDLEERIHGLEEDYDSEVFDTELGDLKEWLQQQGIRLD